MKISAFSPYAGCAMPPVNFKHHKQKKHDHDSSKNSFLVSQFSVESQEFW